MFARLTFIDIAPENAKETRAIFKREIVPVVKEQKGIIDIMLLEPTDPSEQHVSITRWNSKADADAYEASGTYRTLVDKIKAFYRARPVLKTYNVEESMVPAM
jgi:heme-degrading monooxygenase HmoA